MGTLPAETPDALRVARSGLVCAVPVVYVYAGGPALRVSSLRSTD